MKLKILILILLSAFLGYSGVWVFLSMNVGLFLEKASENLKEQGMTFAYSDYSVSGYPFRLEVTMENVSFHFQNGPLSYQLDFKTMQGVTHPWNLSHIIIFPENTNAVLKLGQKRQISFLPEKTSISFSSSGEDNYRLSMVMEKVRVSSTLEFETPDFYETFSTHIRKEPHSETGPTPLLEPNLLEIAFDGTLAGNKRFLISSSFRGQDVPKMTAIDLANWRDNGGTFEIVDFEYKNQTSTISGSGSFTLDENFKPLGSFGFKGASNQALIDFFQEAGLLEASQANLLNTFLATMPPPAEGEEAMSLSVSAQGGFLTLGPARLIEIDSVIQE